MGINKDFFSERNHEVLGPMPKTENFTIKNQIKTYELRAAYTSTNWIH